jgi:predicted DNA binding CopG/RHH family protein
MKTKRLSKRIKLDSFERDIEKSLERNEWHEVQDQKTEKEIAKNAAKQYFRQNKAKRICIRLQEDDLQKLQEIAIEEGLPYQTFIASILHKVAIGRLRDTRF